MNDEKKPLAKYMAFYPSFREAIDMLSNDSKRLAAYDMFTDYGLYGIEPDEDTSQDLLLIFTMGKPNIKKFADDLANGCKGGRPKKAEQQDNEKTPVKTPKKTPKKTPVKTNKDKEKEKEIEKEKDIPFTSLTLKEGDTLPPSADAGGASPFTLMDCLECAKKGKVNLAEEGVEAFYNRMEKDEWKIKGDPVTNLLMAMRGFAKNYKQYQKKTSKKTIMSSIMSKAKKYMNKSIINEFLSRDENWLMHIPEYCPEDIFTSEELEFMESNDICWRAE